jgi:hypothetical protein
MSEVTEANPAEGETAPEVEAEETDILDSQAEAEGDGEEGEEQPEDDLDEVDLDGKKYKVPKDIKAAVMRHADYTKKTMEVAETRRELEARAATLAQEDDAIFNAKAKLVGLNERVQEYEGVDWGYLAEQDRINGTAERETHWAIYQKLQAERSDLGQRLNYTLSQRQAQAERYHATRLEENRQALATAIPGYSPEVLGKLQAYASKEFGIDPREVGDDLNPAAMKVLHRLYTLETAAKTKGQVQKIAQTQQTQPAPTLRGSGGKFSVGADTNDFAAFEKFAEPKLKRR